GGEECGFGREENERGEGSCMLFFRRWREGIGGRAVVVGEERERGRPSFWWSGRLGRKWGERKRGDRGGEVSTLVSGECVARRNGEKGER
ncbi:hypothetical protein HAX54_050557, partial [Datura stramonium]|nr:hypothetical protein [Datura stramonium]